MEEGLGDVWSLQGHCPNSLQSSLGNYKPFLSLLTVSGGTDRCLK